MQTWGDTKDLFNGFLGDTEAAHDSFSAAQALNWANKAIWEMAEHSRPLDLEITFNTAADTPLYVLNSSGHGTLGLRRFEIEDEPVFPVIGKQIREKDRDWHQRTGYPRYYYLDTPVSDPDTYTVGLWRTPDSILASRVILAIVPAAVSDSADTDALQVPRWAAPGILFSMLSDAYMSMGKVKDMAASDFYRGMFEDVLTRLRMRSYNRLPKDVVYGSTPRLRTGTFRDNLPDSIPEPS